MVKKKIALNQKEIVIVKEMLQIILTLVLVLVWKVMSIILGQKTLH